jgi:protein-tyrosine phosphatase
LWCPVATARDKGVKNIPELPKHGSIANFHQVNGWLFRGAQPGVDGFAQLKEQKIKTVVALRWRKWHVAREREIVTNLGMNFYNLPLNYWTLPTKRDVEQFLEIIDDEKNYPVFVHCFHGADRTGVLIAMFRILRCGWTLEDAYVEMLKCGHHRYATYHFKFGLFRLAKQLVVAEGVNLEIPVAPVSPVE